MNAPDNLTAPALQSFAFGDALFRAHLDERGEPWFVAKDVCGALGIEWKGSGSIGPLDADERGSVILNTLGGNQEMLTVSESGLYFLIFRSRKDEAQRFRKWVTSEVLPALRKTGRYAMPGKAALPACELTPAALRLPARQKVLLMNNATQIAKGQNRLEDVREIWAELCNLVAVDASELAQRAASLAEESVREFVKQCCIPSDNPNRRVQASVFYGAYITWCGNVTPEYTPVGKEKFLKLLPVFVPEVRVQRPRKDAPDNRPRSIVGLMLNHRVGLF